MDSGWRSGDRAAFAGWTREERKRGPSMVPRRQVVPGLRLLECDPDPLVDAALALVAGHPDPADLAGVGDVRAAIGLQVEADDLDRADLVDPGGRRLTLVRMRSGMANASSRGRTATRTSRSAASSSLTRASIESTRSPDIVSNSKSIRPGARLHVAAGHERTVVAPDDAAQGVERGVRAHEGEPPRPVEVDLDAGRPTAGGSPSSGSSSWTISPPAFRAPRTVHVRPSAARSSRPRSEGWPPPPGRRRSDRGRRTSPRRAVDVADHRRRPNARTRPCSRAARRGSRRRSSLGV